MHEALCVVHNVVTKNKPHKYRWLARVYTLDQCTNTFHYLFVLRVSTNLLLQ